MLPPLFRWVTVLGVWAGLPLAVTMAHTDPQGDVHPYVTVIGDKFRVGFGTNPPDQPDDYGNRPRVEQVMIFNRDGTLFAPRHAVTMTTAGETAAAPSSSSSSSSTRLFMDYPRSNGNARLRLRSPNGRWSRMRLPWPAGFALDAPDKELLTPQGLFMTGKSVRHGRGDMTDGTTMYWPLKVYWFPHAGTEPPAVLTVGATATIYDFPVASNLVFAGGKLRFAVMQPVGEKKPREEDPPLKLALWSWKPGDAEAKTELLDTPAHWNAHLSMAAIGDDLCLAYHCKVKDSIPPWQSRIITVFRKAD